MKFQFTSKLLLGLTLVLSVAMAGRVIRNGMDHRDRQRMQNLIDALPGTSFNFRTADGKALTDVVTVPTGTLYCVISRNADTRLLLEELLATPTFAANLETILVTSDGEEDCMLDINSHILERLSRFTKLRSLGFLSIRLTDEQLKAVAALPVTDLIFAGHAFDDSSLELISKSQSVVNLEINLTNVTDQSIANLSRMRRLRYIKCSDTKISSAGITELRTRMPSIAIDHPETDTLRVMTNKTMDQSPQ